MMFRRCHLLLFALLVTLIVLNRVHAYYNDYYDDDNDYQDTYYDEHFEGDNCSEEHEDSEDLEEITKLLMQKGMIQDGMTPKGISPMAGGGLILPTVPSNTCSNQWIMDNALRRFNAIFFGDYKTLSLGISTGPLGVKGNINARQLISNGGDNSMDCSAHGTLDVYGLVVGGYINITEEISVAGDSLINGGGDLSMIHEYGTGGCYATDKEGTGIFDFEALEAEANSLSGLYQEHPPTLQITDDGSLKRMANADEDVEYLTFNSCNDRSSCAKIWEGQMSVADHILFSKEEVWKGIQGDLKPDSTKTYVFNIPVIEDTDIVLLSSQPSMGFNICKLLYNFYPVKSDSGVYNPTGVFTLVIQIRYAIGGLVLSPRGNINDTQVGNFKGQIVGKSYLFNYPEPVNYFLSYKGFSETCDYFEGCIPEAAPSCTPQTSTATSFETVTETPNTITTLTQTETVTKGRDTTTQRSTVTTNIEGTQTVTSTATSTFYHIHDENCDEEEEEEEDEEDEKEKNID